MSSRDHPAHGCPRRILVATTNAHKVLEIRELLSLPETQLLTLADLARDDIPAAEETGETFEENALIKAFHYASSSDLPTLADDSGLVVDALDGAPGVQSARWMGEGTPYSEKNSRLLELLADLPVDRRTARFVCAAALAWPDGCVLSSRGVAEGRIHDRIAGAGGFGYDPVFWSFEGQTTFGLLPADQKNRMSHRAKAVGSLARLLARLPSEDSLHR